MLPRTYENQVCSVARALEVLGDRWTLLVLRDAFSRVRRFEDFQRSLGVARNVLTDRLSRLVDEGILKRVPYQERPVRFEYRLTEKGREYTRGAIERSTYVLFASLLLARIATRDRGASPTTRSLAQGWTRRACSAARPGVSTA